MTQVSLHTPFALRKNIVVVSALLAIAPAFLFENLWLFFAVYFFGAVAGDVLVHGLGLKPSLDPEQLLLGQRVTPSQFAFYCKTRFLIRLASLSAALIVLAIASFLFPSIALQVFCASYVLTTWLGIGVVRLKKIARPKVVERDDSLYVPRGPRPGYISPEHWALNKSTGFPILRPVDF